MQFNYKPSGVCTRQISFDIDDGIITNVNFTSGCAGNTQGVAKLCEGRSAEDVINLLSDIKCGFKSTSCPDQLAKAVKAAIQQQ